MTKTTETISLVDPYRANLDTGLIHLCSGDIDPSFPAIEQFVPVYEGERTDLTSPYGFGVETAIASAEPKRLIKYFLF